MKARAASRCIDHGGKVAPILSVRSRRPGAPNAGREADGDATKDRPGHAGDGGRRGDVRARRRRAPFARASRPRPAPSSSRSIPPVAPITVANYLAHVDRKLLDGGAVYRIVTLANQPPETRAQDRGRAVGNEPARRPAAAAAADRPRDDAADRPSPSRRHRLDGARAARHARRPSTSSASAPSPRSTSAAAATRTARASPRSAASSKGWTSCAPCTRAARPISTWRSRSRCARCAGSRPLNSLPRRRDRRDRRRSSRSRSTQCRQRAMRCRLALVLEPHRLARARRDPWPRRRGRHRAGPSRARTPARPRFATGARRDAARRFSSATRSCDRKPTQTESFSRAWRWTNPAAQPRLGAPAATTRAGGDGSGSGTATPATAAEVATAISSAVFTSALPAGDGARPPSPRGRRSRQPAGGDVDHVVLVGRQHRDAEIAPIQACRSTRGQPRTAAAKRAQRMTSTLMCSDGARLNGRSTVHSHLNRSAAAPAGSCRSKSKRSGPSSVARRSTTSRAMTRRSEWCSRSSRSRQAKKDAAKRTKIREVRQDAQLDERDRALPREDAFADVAAQAGQLVARPVERDEGGRDLREPDGAMPVRRGAGKRTEPGWDKGRKLGRHGASPWPRRQRCAWRP